jgi:acylphosphatase
MTPERWNVVFSGQVQGVGFRFRSQLAAQNYLVTGWVANLANGQVEMVVEGEAEEIENFINELRDKMAGLIGQVDIDKAQPRGEFNRFEIRR